MPARSDEDAGAVIHNPVHSPDHSTAIQTHAPSAINQNFEHSKLLPWLMLTAALSGVALALSVSAMVFAHIENSFTMSQLQQTQNEAYKLSVMVEDQNALMLREGIKLPTDEIYGPGNNLEYGMKGDGHGRNRVSDRQKRSPSVRKHPN